MMIRYPCSACGQDLQANERRVGMETRCPHCLALAVVPLPHVDLKWLQPKGKWWHPEVMLSRLYSWMD